MIASAGSSGRPNIPSAIVTVMQVMYTQIGPTGATGASGPSFTSLFTYKVGDTGPGGGIIFFVDRFNEYPDFTYLEAIPPSEVIAAGSGWSQWSPIDYTSTAVSGADLRKLGGGHQNTIDICAQGTNLSQPAAGVCSTIEYGGQTDWYLGSVSELSLIYNVCFFQLGINYPIATYWSSSEYSATHAWTIEFSTSLAIGRAKGTTSYYAIPMRRF